MSPLKSDYVSDVWKDSIFTNKIVFCTGGAGTICSAQVRALVHLGADACIIGRNVEKTEKMAQEISSVRHGARVLGIGNTDVRSLASLEAAVQRCNAELGRIDYVIAGAAGNFLAPISGLSANAMKSVIDIDILGSYNTLKATLPDLLASAKASARGPGKTPASGRIIFISATIHYTTMPLQTHVSVAKAGVDALSHSVAIEYGPHGVTSNCIAPGPIAGTEGMARLSRKEDEQRVSKAIPLGRWGTVKEIADGTVYLFADTGDYVNGQILVIDGAAWRTAGAALGEAFQYPDFLLAQEPVSGVQGLKKDNRDSAKAKL